MSRPITVAELKAQRPDLYAAMPKTLRELREQIEAGKLAARQRIARAIEEAR